MWNVIICVILLFTRLRASSDDFLTPNWTHVAELASTGESSLLPFEYVELAPCICDVTVNQCDLWCCCDLDCADQTVVDVFGCTTFDDRYLTTECSLPLPDVLVREPAFILLCRERETSPFLGYFYPNRPVIGKQLDFDSVFNFYNAAAEPRSFKGAFEENLLRSKYEHGSPLHTTTNTWLSLPQPFLNGQCTDQSPLRFMENIDSECVTVLTADSCVSQSRFSVHSYITPQSLPSEDQQTRFNLYTNASRQQTVPKTVKYLCPTSAQGSITSTAGISTTKSYWFPSWTSTTTDSDAKTEAQCRLGSGLSTPSEPSYDQTTSICSNVVHSVTYDFAWNSFGMASVVVTLVLKDVNIYRPDQHVAQHFRANWKHTKSNDITVRRLQTPASGHPGYNPGAPLLALVVDENDENSNGNENFVFDEEKQLVVWSADQSGLCAFSTPRRVAFAENITSSCYIQITDSAFDDCDQLRDSVTRGLQMLVQPTRISRGGQLIGGDVNSEAVVEIFREQLNYSTLYSELELLSRPNISRHHCFDVPTHVGVDVFYSETAHQPDTGAQAFEVSGAYTYLNVTTWSFSSTQFTQRVLLTATVRFYQRPPGRPPNVKRYDLKETRFHCPSYVTCWDEVLYPFMKRNIGTDYAYSLAMGCVLVVIIGGVYWVTNPWAV